MRYSLHRIATSERVVVRARQPITQQPEVRDPAGLDKTATAQTARSKADD